LTMPTIFEIKKEMVEVGKLMYQKGLVIAKHGNISYKVNDNEFICTPGGLCKAFLTPDKLVRVNANGESLEAGKKPTSEIRMHIAIYKLRPDINCIVHAQPAATTAFAISGVEAKKFVLPSDAATYFGYVPAEAYDKKNHDANTLAQYMGDKKQMAYIFHGDSSLSVGDTLYNAFDNIESLEHYCRVSTIARSLHALETCSTEELVKELAKRTGECVCPHCGKSGCHGECCKKDGVCNGSCKTGACTCGKNDCCEPAPAAACEPDVGEVVRRVIAALNQN